MARHGPFSWFLSKRERERGGERDQDLSLRSTIFRRLEFVEPKVKVHLLDEGYAWVLKMKDFDEDPKKKIRGKSKFSGLGGVLGTSYRLDYTSRGRDPSYSRFSLHLFVDFWIKMVERVNGLFGQKNAQNPTFFA